MLKKNKPELPGTIEWAPETLDWYAAWRSSPRTDSWDNPQWQYMFDTALVHSALYGSQDFSMLPELRTRLQYLGIEFDKLPPKIEVRVTPLDDIRKKRNAERRPVRKPSAKNTRSA